MKIIQIVYLLHMQAEFTLFEDIGVLKDIGNGLVDVTIGSSLDIFGGSMSFKKVLEKVTE